MTHEAKEFEVTLFTSNDGFEIELIHRNEIVEVINVNLWKKVEREIKVRLRNMID